MLCSFCRSPIGHFAVTERGIDFCSTSCCNAVFLPDVAKTSEERRVTELRRKAGVLREYAEGTGVAPTREQVRAFVAILDKTP